MSEMFSRIDLKDQNMVDTSRAPAPDVESNAREKNRNDNVRSVEPVCIVRKVVVRI